MVTLNFTDNQIEINQGEIKNINFALTASSNKKISGIDLSFKFDEGGKDLIDYQQLTTTPENYFDDKIYEKVESKDNKKILRIVLVTKKTTNQLVSSLIFSLKFKAKNSEGETFLTYLDNSGQISGPTEKGYFDIKIGEKKFHQD